MNDIGQLYVLANSAMPGLVKVGKTTRSPAERAAELSSATGLPTPFIVVYEQLFADCTSAEAFVHSYLADKGFRVADNREFFSAPVSEVVRAISMAPSLIGNDIELNNNTLLRREADESGCSQLNTQNLPSPPWQSVLAEADRTYLGLEDTLQDYKEALRLYIQAAKLGALPAYGRIGKMYRTGEGVTQDLDRGLAYFKEGARKGSIYCHWALGMAFTSLSDPSNRHIPNAEKCFSQFVSSLNDHVVDSYHLTQSETNSVLIDCATLLCPIYRNEQIIAALHSFIREYSQGVEDAARVVIEGHAGDGFSDVRKQYESAILYIRSA